MTSGVSTFNDFPENQCTSLNSINASREHGVPRVVLFKARFFQFSLLWI